MRIKIVTRHRTDKGEIGIGPELEVDDEEGKRLIRGGIAEELDAPKAKRARKAEVQELEVEEPDDGPEHVAA